MVEYGLEPSNDFVADDMEIQMFEYSGNENELILDIYIRVRYIMSNFKISFVVAYTYSENVPKLVFRTILDQSVDLERSQNELV